MAEPRKREDWREEAISLGVNPDEPDDHRYWGMLDRARGILDSFKYYQPNQAQIERIAQVRRAHIECAKAILRYSPVNADQTAALRLLHESMMTTNKAIVNEVKSG